MTPSDKAMELVKKFEGFQSKAYKCPAGVWTIGYGTTVYPSLSKVKEGDSCTQQEADLYLENDLQHAGKAVEEYVDADLTQEQFDALCSFVYNLGEGNFRSSTLLKLINSGDYKGAALQFMRWNKAGGMVLRGLTLRREAERDLFVSA